MSLDSLTLYRTITGPDPRARDDALQALGAWLHRLACRKLGTAAGAEDCVQEALVRIWKGVGCVREPAAFGGWCATLLNAVIVDGWRHELGVRREDERPDGSSRRPVSLDALLDGKDGPREDLEPASGGPGVDERVEDAALSASCIRALMDAMGRCDLSADSRAVIAGGYLKDKTDRELAAQIGKTPNNVGVIRHRDLGKLRGDESLLAELRAWADL